MELSRLGQVFEGTDYQYSSSKPSSIPCLGFSIAWEFEDHQTMRYQLSNYPRVRSSIQSPQVRRILLNRYLLSCGDSSLALNASSTASILVCLQSDCLSIIGAGGIIRVLVARADTHEEDTEGGNRGGEDCAACFSGGPDGKSRAEPYYHQGQLLLKYQYEGYYQIGKTYM